LYSFRYGHFADRLTGFFPAMHVKIFPVMRINRDPNAGTAISRVLALLLLPIGYLT